MWTELARCLLAFTLLANMVIIFGLLHLMMMYEGAG